MGDGRQLCWYHRCIDGRFCEGPARVSEILTSAGHRCQGEFPAPTPMWAIWANDLRKHILGNTCPMVTNEGALNTSSMSLISPCPRLWRKGRFSPWNLLVNTGCRFRRRAKARAERAAAEKGLHGLCQRGLAGKRIGIPLKDLLGLNPALFPLYFLAQAFSAARSSCSPMPGPTSEPPGSQACESSVPGLCSFR